MQWVDLLDLCESGVKEDITDTTTDFFRKYPLKLWASYIQTQASRAIGFDTYYSFTTTASTAEYALPHNFIKAQGVRYNDSYWLSETYKMPNVAPSTSTGSPMTFYVRGNYVGLWPTPGTSSVAVYMNYKYYIDPYAMKLKYLTAGGATSVTMAIETSTTYKYLTFVVSGGAHAGTYQIDLNNNSYNTMAEVQTYINGTTGIKSVLYCSILQTSGVYPQTSSWRMEEFAAVDITNTDRQYFFEPLLPEEMQMEILFPAMMYRMKMDDREYKVAQQYQMEYLAAIEKYRVIYKERYWGSKPLGFGNDNIDNRVQPLGTGGFLVIP